MKTPFTTEDIEELVELIDGFPYNKESGLAKLMLDDLQHTIHNDFDIAYCDITKMLNVYLNEGLEKLKLHVTNYAENENKKQR